MSIREQILADIKEAMKAKDKFKRDTLRTLNAALKQVEVDQRIEMTDEVVLPLLQKEIKKRADSVELYLKGEREDLAKKRAGRDRPYQGLSTSAVERRGAKSKDRGDHPKSW